MAGHWIVLGSMQLEPTPAGTPYGDAHLRRVRGRYGHAAAGAEFDKAGKVGEFSRV